MDANITVNLKKQELTVFYSYINLKNSYKTLPQKSESKTPYAPIL